MSWLCFHNKDKPLTMDQRKRLEEMIATALEAEEEEDNDESSR